MRGRVGELRFGVIAIGLLVVTVGLPRNVAAAGPQPAEEQTPIRESSPFGATHPTRQDGRFIPRLEWTAPDDEEPGTYPEYLELHPLVPARFSKRPLGAARAEGTGPPGRVPAGIALLVDDTLYPTIVTALDQYVTDLTLRGYSVHLETVSGGTPGEIKAWIQGKHGQRLLRQGPRLPDRRPDAAVARARVRR